MRRPIDRESEDVGTAVVTGDVERGVEIDALVEQDRRSLHDRHRERLGHAGIVSDLHERRQVLREVLEEVGLAPGADEARALLAVDEEDEGRHRHDPVAGRGGLAVVDIDLGYVQVLGLLRGDGAERGREHLAGPAPAGAEFDEHGAVGAEHELVEGLVVEVRDRHATTVRAVRRYGVKGSTALTPYLGTAGTVHCVRAFTIGSLAREAGVNVETVRYYERRGLIRQPVRQGSEYREYSDADVARLRLIRRAKDLGFTLSEIRELLPATDTGCADGVLAAARATLARLDADLEVQHARRARLAQLVAECADGGPDCVTLDVAG